MRQFEYRLRWNDVEYAPGKLRVVAYKHGSRWAEQTVRTVGAAARLIPAPDRRELNADGTDLCFITVTVADAAGATVPRAGHRVRFEIEGAGEIVAVDNGDPTSHEPFNARECRAFNGLCLIIVRTRAG